jgi:hypothetical protein
VTSPSHARLSHSYARLFRSHWPLALVLALILGLRLWFALAFPIVQVSDYQAYYQEARGFAGLGPLGVSAVYAIAPKLFYAVLFRLFGDDLRVIGVTNAITYAVAVSVLYVAVRRTFGPTTALLTSVLCLVSLSELYFNNLASTEVLGTLSINWIFLLMASAAASRRRSFFLGLAAGIAIYNRSNMLPIGALVLAYDWLCGGRLGPALKRAALVQAVALAVTLPLCVFNWTRFGRFTPLIANAQTLWYGNNPKLSGDFHHYTEVPEDLPPGTPERRRLREEFAAFYATPDENLDFRTLSPYEIQDVKVRYALAWIRKNPGRYLELVFARFQLYFFSCSYGEAPYRTSYRPLDDTQPRWTPGHERLIARVRLPVRRLYQLLIAGAALGALATALQHGLRGFARTALGLPLLIVGFYATPFLLTIGANRYHIPILSLCWVYLAHGLVLLGAAMRRRSHAFRSAEAVS